MILTLYQMCKDIISIYASNEDILLLPIHISQEIRDQQINQRRFMIELRYVTRGLKAKLDNSMEYSGRITSIILWENNRRFWIFDVN